MSWVENWLNLFRTLSIWEWIYWIVLTLVTIKGFIEYPNILNNTDKRKA